MCRNVAVRRRLRLCANNKVNCEKTVTESQAYRGLPIREAARSVGGGMPNSALLTDAFTSPLRAQHDAAKRERSASTCNSQSQRSVPDGCDLSVRGSEAKRR